MFVSSLSSMSSCSILGFSFVCVEGSVLLFVVGGEDGVLFGEAIVGVGVGVGEAGCVDCVG